MATFSNANEEAIREELLKKSVEISKDAKEVSTIETETVVSPYDELIKNGIDVKSSIGLYGSEELFKTKLEEFANIAKTEYGRLIDCKASMNMQEYASESKIIKDLSNRLGIEQLFIMAKMHEQKALKKDTDYVIEHFKEYEDEIMKVINIINEYFS